jgi:formiminotetrahydrofolate cyclodeaminase
MNFLNSYLNDFIDQIDSKNPTPGGGSVSALSALLGVSLIRMVGHLTIGRKAYRSLEPSVQEEMLQSFSALEQLKLNLLPLIDKDASAFNEIMKAYKLPKDTEHEIKVKEDAILKATIQAIEVPLSVAKLSLEALKLTPVFEQYGNKNAISDIHVALLELNTAIKGALMNVEVNVTGLTDDLLKERYTKESEHIKEQSQDFTKKHLDIV